MQKDSKGMAKNSAISFYHTHTWAAHSTYAETCSRPAPAGMWFHVRTASHASILTTVICSMLICWALTTASSYRRHSIVWNGGERGVESIRHTSGTVVTVRRELQTAGVWAKQSRQMSNRQNGANGRRMESRADCALSGLRQEVIK